jgi:3-hydroxybutyryl-CoA dehydrogenase
VRVHGEGFVVSSWARMAKTAGIEVHHDTASCTENFLALDKVKIYLSDGRLAAERKKNEDDICLIDFAFDFEASASVALTFNDDIAEFQKKQVVGFFQAMGKQVFVIDDVPGLITLPTLAMIINEAADAFLQGLASKADIDLAMRNGVNYPAGPFEWLEILGAELVLSVLDNLNRIYPSGRYRASRLLRKQAAGRN